MRWLFAWLAGLLRVAPADDTALQLEELRRALKKQIEIDEAKKWRRRRD